MKLATRMERLGTETAFEVLVRARALEAQGQGHRSTSRSASPISIRPANIIEAGADALQNRLDPLRPVGRVARSASTRSPTI